jgi:hypothetical protein
VMYMLMGFELATDYPLHNPAIVAHASL